MIKIFIASSPNKPNNNLSNFYAKLKSDENIDLLHPTCIDDFNDNELKDIKVLEYELARIDKIKILESKITIIDWDSETRNAYLYWSCINPESKIIVVSRIFPNIDLFASEKVIAIVKPELLLTMLYSYLGTQEVASQDKQDPAHD